MFYFEQIVLLAHDYKHKQAKLSKTFFSCLMIGAILLDLKKIRAADLINGPKLAIKKRSTQTNNVLDNFLRLLDRNSEKYISLNSLLYSVTPSLETLKEMVIIYMQQQKFLLELPYSYSPILTKEGHLRKAQIICEFLTESEENDIIEITDYLFIKLIEVCNLTSHFLNSNQSKKVFRRKVEYMEARLNIELVFEVKDDLINLEMSIMNTILSGFFITNKTNLFNETKS